MLDAVTTALPTVLGWLGDFVTALTGETGDLKDLWPLAAVGIVISLIMLGVKVIKSFAWGT